MNAKNIILVIGILIVAAIIFVSRSSWYAGYMEQQKVIPAPAASSQATTSLSRAQSIEIERAQSVPREIKWEWYYDPELGFEFQYPAGTTINRTDLTYGVTLLLVFPEVLNANGIKFPPTMIELDGTQTNTSRLVSEGKCAKHSTADVASPAASYLKSDVSGAYRNDDEAGTYAVAYCAAYENASYTITPRMFTSDKAQADMIFDKLVDLLNVQFVTFQNNTLRETGRMKSPNVTSARVYMNETIQVFGNNFFKDTEVLFRLNCTSCKNYIKVVPYSFPYDGSQLDILIPKVPGVEIKTIEILLRNKEGGYSDPVQVKL